MENPDCLNPIRHVKLALKAFGERGSIFVDFPLEALARFFYQFFPAPFTSNCNFRDVYLLAYLLQEFGVELIYSLNPPKQYNTTISVGTFIHQMETPKKNYLYIKIQNAIIKVKAKRIS